MANSPNGNSGCFSAILRHLLCSDGAPTHPSDDALLPAPTSKHSPDVNPILIKESPKRDAARTHRPPQKPAGVVARLMGLDTLPDAKWVPRARSPDAFLRSRSVNFMDYLLELNLDDEVESNRHRRVRTSVSFREVPTLLADRGKSDDLIVLYLGDEEDLGTSNKKKKKKGESRGRRNQKTVTKKKKKMEMEMDNEREEGKERKVSRLRDEPRRVKVSQRHREERHCTELLKLKGRKPLTVLKEKEASAGDVELANGGRSNKRAAIGGGGTSWSPVSVPGQPPATSPLKGSLSFGSKIVSQTSLLFHMPSM